MKTKGMGKIFLAIGLIAAVITAAALYCKQNAHLADRPALSLPRGLQNTDDELEAGKAYTINDEKGSLITMISRRVQAGNEIITHEGKRYRVQKVDGYAATARFVGMDRELIAYNEYFSNMELPAFTTSWKKRPVAIYHTHSDESYLPSDGKISIPFKGGIFDVGDSYTQNLSENRTSVLHDKTPHDPHDNNAYHRSRRTAMALLKKNPIAMFDVHRDGVDDPGFYQRVISNQQVAQIRFVVGRQNPNYRANLDFAKRLMAYANQMHWPIAKDIYIGSGNYNQDLLSTALLIEAGTYSNRKDEAMRGIAQLADAVPVILGITGPPSRPGAPEYQKPVTDPTARQPGAWSSIFWVLLTVLAGGAAYLLASAGSWQKAKRHLSSLFSRELADILGPLAKKIQPRRRDKDGEWPD